MGRAIVTMLALLIAIGSARAQPAAKPAPASPPGNFLTPWNIQATTEGGTKKITVFGGTPDDFLPSCRCVAGIWQLGRNGESATHFTGTLQGTSVNHPRAAVAAKLKAKIRKTRHLMGAADEHRKKLQAIMASTGQLILREVKGGEWEVVGYSVDILGDLFANNPRWRVDPKKPPAPVAASPILDPAADAIELAKLINDYRVSLGLPRLPTSPALTKVAQAHVRDLNVNKPMKEGCNMHSWSTKGTWSACCYDGSPAAARCMWKKPKEISGYPGNGYEIAAAAPSGMTPDLALSQWQKSQAHHEVMINKGKWKQPWGTFGVAVEGTHSVAWFGNDPDGK